MTDQYAVVGNPITHSLSPQIHTAFAEQTDQDIAYEKKHVEIGEFDSFVKSFFTQGGKGLNITIPFKENAWQVAEHCNVDAELAKAVNTLYQVNGQLVGANTDGKGLVQDIQYNYQFKLADKRILLLGAGGAVRGVLGSLIDCKPKNILLANRTFSRAQQLHQDIVDQLPEVKDIITCQTFDAIAAFEFDIIINGTAASLHGDTLPIAPMILQNHPICYDMFYSAKSTAFNQWAINHGMPKKYTIDGLGMLVEQAAEAFLIWRSAVEREQLNTQLVIDQLRDQLNLSN